MFILPPVETERRVQIRLMRQELLIKDPPLQLSVVLDESVLHRRFGGKAVMRQQLERLLEASALPNVDLHVLRFEANHPIGSGAFFYLEFPQIHDVPMRDSATVEHLLGSYYIEDEEETYKFRVTFERLVAESLDVVASRALIEEMARRNWS
jgi:hypothetical protein